MRKPTEIDHIEPTWKEGRDYQLVCGFDAPVNYCERDYSLNVRKSNRFIPWRVAEGEIGTVPVNEGDLCQFLDSSTGEWILEEFLGDWWFEQTKNLCGSSIAGRISGALAAASGQLASVRQPRKGGLAVFTQKVGIGALTSEQLSKQGSLPWWYNPFTSETTRSESCPGADWEPGRGPLPFLSRYENVNVDKYICLQTGYISTAAGVAAWQKKRNIPSTKRVKLTPEEAAFIFLWDS